MKLRVGSRRGSFILRPGPDCLLLVHVESVLGNADKEERIRKEQKAVGQFKKAVKGRPPVLIGGVPILPST